MRIAHAPGRKGSQKWLQHLVALAPERLQPPGIAPLDWVSPLADDDFAEYRDGDFLHRLGLGRLALALGRFWPRGGPVWDGLARAGEAVVLVEAKSHLAEAHSPPCAARSSASRQRIAAALEAARVGLGAAPGTEWTQHFYQYANRLAHLWWLREQGVEAHLLLIGFLGDAEMGGPDQAGQWNALYARADAALGLAVQHPLRAAVHHLHPDMRSS